ncbi:hypothetical protein D1159_18755 [Pseudoflavonifractor sp. 524-17]|nr:hypothetical protein [Pseudoflavonifractor sp. 524-17]
MGLENGGLGFVRLLPQCGVNALEVLVKIRAQEFAAARPLVELVVRCVSCHFAFLLLGLVETAPIGDGNGQLLTEIVPFRGAALRGGTRALSGKGPGPKGPEGGCSPLWPPPKRGRAACEFIGHEIK